MILTESRSLAGVLRGLAREYAVPTASTNGQCGGFLHTDVAPALSTGQRVLYLGDLDLSGGQIEANTRHVLEREAGALRWERLALTQNQANRHHLPVIVKPDRRYRDGGRHEAIETEALHQEVLAGILRGCLDDLPEPLECVLEREQAEREQLRALLNGGSG
jgi:hypothetical protein